MVDGGGVGDGAEKHDDDENYDGKVEEDNVENSIQFPVRVLCFHGL